MNTEGSVLYELTLLAAPPSTSEIAPVLSVSGYREEDRACEGQEDTSLARIKTLSL